MNAFNEKFKIERWLIKPYTYGQQEIAIVYVQMNAKRKYGVACLEPIKTLIVESLTLIAFI